MEKLNEYLSELKKLETNIKKSKDRIYSAAFKIEKLKRLQYIKEEFEKFEENKDSKFLILKFKEIFENILLLVQNLAVKEEKILESENFSNMAQFDINIVGKNLQIFKGNFETLEDFLVQSELLHDMLRAEDKTMFIKYVYNFKLTAQVRNIIGRSVIPVTFTDLRKLLIESYPNPRTLQQVLAELGTIRQGRIDISTFREKIALLTSQLSTFEIASITNPTQDVKSAICKMSENMALNVFMKGVNAEYKSMLIASNPKTFREAAEKCLIMERESHTTDNNIYRVWRRNDERFRNTNFNAYRNNSNQNHTQQRNFRNNNYNGNAGNNVYNRNNNNSSHSQYNNRSNNSNNSNNNSAHSYRSSDQNRNRNDRNRNNFIRNNNQGN